MYIMSNGQENRKITTQWSRRQDGHDNKLGCNRTAVLELNKMATIIDQITVEHCREHTNVCLLLATGLDSAVVKTSAI